MVAQYNPDFVYSDEQVPVDILHTEDGYYGIGCTVKEGTSEDDNILGGSLLGKYTNSTLFGLYKRTTLTNNILNGAFAMVIDQGQGFSQGDQVAIGTSAGPHTIVSVNKGTGAVNFTPAVVGNQNAGVEIIPAAGGNCAGLDTCVGIAMRAANNGSLKQKEVITVGVAGNYQLSKIIGLNAFALVDLGATMMPVWNLLKL